MPINLRDIASISGMPGLFRIVRPTRNGVIVESLDEKQTRSVAQARQRLSLLQEISIYTTDAEETVPLAQVMENIRNTYGDKLPVTAKASGAELEAFMAEVVPTYDPERVYTSDMKKLVQWYTIANKYCYQTEPIAPEAAQPEAEPATEEVSAKPAKAKAAKAGKTEKAEKEEKAPKAEKPAAKKKAKTEE